MATVVQVSTTIPVGPAALGLRLGSDATVGAGWAERALVIPGGLDGPPGILQGGLAAGVTAPIARVADTFGAPVTSVEARLHAPTPLASTVRTRVRRSEGVGRYQVELAQGDGLLVTAEVEYGGHDPAPLGLDLLELATVPFPEAVPQQEYPSCFVCGPSPSHPCGLRLHPRPGPADTIVQPWVADEVLAAAPGGVVDPLVVAAVLDCPTVWAGIRQLRADGYLGALLAGFRLQFYRDVPIDEPLRIVARSDGLDGRKLRARAAVVDEDLNVYAIASALHIAVTELPSPTLS